MSYAEEAILKALHLGKELAEDKLDSIKPIHVERRTFVDPQVKVAEANIELFRSAIAVWEKYY